MVMGILEHRKEWLLLILLCILRIINSIKRKFKIYLKSLSRNSLGSIVLLWKKIIKKILKNYKVKKIYKN